MKKHKATVYQRLKSAFNYVFGGGAYESVRNQHELKNWYFTRGLIADEEIIKDLPTLRAQSRDLYRNNPVGRGAIKVITTNVIGAGLRFQANIDREFLGLSEEAAGLWEFDLERRFRLWAESAECDAERRLNFFELQEIAFSSYLQSGDCFALLPLIEREGTPNALRVKLIESDLVCNPYNAMNSDTLRDGVELGAYGDPVRYHIKRDKTTWDVLDAFGGMSGRPNIIHLYRPERPGQTRGVPLLASVMTAIKQIGNYFRAELAASAVAALYTVFIKSNNPNALDNPLGDDGKESDPFNYELKTGAVYHLEDNEDIAEANPVRPNPNFGGFIDGLLRLIGMAIEVPFEILAKQFASSYSASRGAKLEAWKYFWNQRQWFAMTFCQVIYEEWLTEEVAEGRVHAPGYFESYEIRKAYSGAMWLGDADGQIDEEKAARAAKLKLEAGLSTYHIETAKNGGDFDRNIRVLKREMEKLKEVLPQQGTSAPGGMNVPEIGKPEATIQ